MAGIHYAEFKRNQELHRELAEVFGEGFASECANNQHAAFEATIQCIQIFVVEGYEEIHNAVVERYEKAIAA
jgi:hypothetical protein